MLLRDFDPADLARGAIPISVDEDASKASDEIVAGNDRIPVAPLVAVWDQQFFGALEPDMLGEILVATNYLEIKPMYDIACQMVVNVICSRNTVEMRTILNIQSDLTGEQEHAIRSEPMRVFKLHDLLSGDN
ncbi:Skp1 family, dimerization domain-containing protein [Staphylotrichum tortipilum]|uniref:Skp1 family, dimerization domain-containing protein n=1 Tax=Staphylotrichum tortipilum TaxID=2831512 RepID=A0AAN6MNY7_9PEZI|nr:Skp1 family, dimerization domain-containing protein [Staphylotrichum longicolle]